MEIKNKSLKNIVPFNKKKTKCVNCSKKAKDPFIPFCSKKCSDQDLMKWLSDEHSLNIDFDQK